MCHVLVRGLQWPVRGRVCEVQEERLVRIVPGRLLHKLDRMLCERVGGIVVFWQGQWHGCIIQGQHLVPGRLVEIAGPANQPVKPVKPTVSRPHTAECPNMPLTGHQGTIPRLVQGFSQCHTVPVQGPLVGRVTIVEPLILILAGHVPDPGLVGVKTRQQGCTRGTTSRRVVEVSEPNAPVREPLQIGRSDFSTVRADVRVPKIIGQNEDNIGPLRRRRPYRDLAQNAYDGHHYTG